MDSALWGEWKVRTQNGKSLEAVEQTQNSEADYRIPSESIGPGQTPRESAESPGQNLLGESDFSTTAHCVCLLHTEYAVSAQIFDPTL